MKRASLTLLSAALLTQLAACVSTEHETSTPSRSTYTPPKAADGTRLSSKTVLNTVATTHSFSDPASVDRFVLQLRGAHVINSQAHLIVTNAAGDTLRHEVLPARALLNEQTLADPQAATARDKEIAILRGMNNFFSPNHFVTPAVPAAAPQPAEVDGATWQALRNDPKAVAFDYMGADGGERRLAYVQALHKTVVLSQ